MAYKLPPSLPPFFYLQAPQHESHKVSYMQQGGGVQRKILYLWSKIQNIG